MYIYHKCDSVRYNSATHSMTNFHTWRMNSSTGVHGGSDGLPETTIVTFVPLIPLEVAIVTVGTGLLVLLIILLVTVDAGPEKLSLVDSTEVRSSLMKDGHLVNHFSNYPRDVLASQELPISVDNDALKVLIRFLVGEF